MTNRAARTRSQRRQDTRHWLEDDTDAWVAAADGDTPYLVPLSFLWEGETMLVATSAASPTGCYLTRDGAWLNAD